MAADNSLINWTETSPGVWERGLDEAENNFKIRETLFEGSGKVYFAVTAHISISVPLLDGQNKETQSAKVNDALRKGWIACRSDMPTLAAKVVYNSAKPFFRKVYETPKSAEDIQKWVDACVVFVDGDLKGSEFTNTQPPVPKQPTIFVLSPPSPADVIRRDVVLRTSHEMIDGVGSMLLLNTFVRHAAKAYEEGDSWRSPALDGSETQRLSPPYQVAAGLTNDLTETQKSKLEAIIAELASKDEGVTVLSVPFKKGNLLPGKHQRRSIKFSVDETNKLLQACKKAGITPTHAFHAAIAMTIRDLQPPQSEPATGRYISWIVRNERPFCQPPYNSAQHAVTCYGSLSGRFHVDLDMPTAANNPESTSQSHKEEFHKSARHIKAFYEKTSNDPDLYALVRPICALATPELPEAEFAPNPHRPVPPPRDTATASLSSMGKLDNVMRQEHGLFQVHNPWASGEELGNGYGCYLATFRGEMEFAGVCNDAWHGDEDLNVFLARCKDVVYKNLGLGLTPSAKL